MKPFALLLCSFLLAMLPRSSATDSPSIVNSDSCPDGQIKTKTAYLGWPVQISCYLLGFVDAVFYSGEEAQCRVVDYDTKETLWNETMILDEDAVSLSDNVYDFVAKNVLQRRFKVMYLRQEICESEIIELKIKELGSHKCEEIPETSQLKFANDLGEKVTLKCAHKDWELEFNEDQNITFVWTRNCSSALPEDAILRGDSLTLFKTRFEDAGIYQCAALYNGKSHYIVENQLCLRFPSTQHHSVTMKCPGVVEARPGQDINITCLADLGVGKANGIDFSSKWVKAKGNMTCNNSIPERRDNATDPRAQCHIHSSLEKTCYYYNPQMEAPREIIEVVLNIRNVRESDTGEYSITFTARSNLSATEKVIVALNRDRDLHISTAAIVSSLCILLLLILLLILVLWYKYDVLWALKMKFGRYDLDSCSYMAYLAYYYDNNNKSSTVDPSTLVFLVEDFIRKIGGEPFNPERDVPPGQNDIENMCNVFKDSHRIIVILTPEYIEDDMSIMKVYKGFEKEIEEQRKIIFIHLPGTQKAINNLNKKQKTGLKKAIQMNRSLSWSGQNPLDGKFKRRLEYFLPKLPSRHYDRSHSNSSQAKLTKPRGQVYSVFDVTSNPQTVSV